LRKVGEKTEKCRTVKNAPKLAAPLGLTPGQVLYGDPAAVSGGEAA
jgi:hypothetical protein